MAIGITGIVLTLGGIILSIVFYLRNRDEILRGIKTESIYLDLLGELVAIDEEDVFPGGVGKRYSASHASEINQGHFYLMDSTEKEMVQRYRQALVDLESGEERLSKAVPKIKQEFPEVLAQADETSVRLVVGGVADHQMEGERSGPDAPKFVQMRTEMPFEKFFDGKPTEVLEAENADEVRKYLTPEEGAPEDLNLDEPVFDVEYGDPSLTPRNVAFLDENLPEWDETLARLIQSGVVRDYLEAKKQEEVAKEELQEVSTELRRIVEDQLPKQE